MHRGLQVLLSIFLLQDPDQGFPTRPAGAGLAGCARGQGERVHPILYGCRVERLGGEEVWIRENLGDGQGGQGNGYGG
jgi:hypothetical protein